MSDPDEFLSAEENEQEFETFFESANDYLPDIKKIDFNLDSSFSYSFYDSEKCIATFGGCLRFGKFSNFVCLGNTVSGFQKKNCHEWPIFSIQNAVKAIKNAFIFFFNKTAQPKDFLICNHPLKHILSHEIIGDCRTISFKSFDKGGNLHYVETFNKVELLTSFSNELKKILFSVTAPCGFLQNVTNDFIKKLLEKDKDQVKKLIDHWKKNQKMKILWNASSEMISKEETNPSRQSISFLFNFLKNNIVMIENVFILSEFLTE